MRANRSAHAGNIGVLDAALIDVPRTYVHHRPVHSLVFNEWKKLLALFGSELL